ncbi:hypothetical protein Tco_0975012 [Tanacetum coccineum]|uniref:Uncharacterized protein n=1 Tax=Tanacetum coccineum TaxID=301880 RepID=A0ABQ5ED86_9ASTR
MITRPLLRPSILSSICSMSSRGSSSKAEVEEDDRERVHFRDGKISSRRKKSWESNSGNTGNGGKTVGGAIGACGSGIVSEAKRSLDKSSEGSEEVFPGEAGK